MLQKLLMRDCGPPVEMSFDMTCTSACLGAYIYINNVIFCNVTVMKDDIVCYIV